MMPRRNKAAPRVSRDATGDLELKRTILAMRSQMEQIQFDKRQAARKIAGELRDEIGQLKQTIVALREELERQKGRHSEEIQLVKQRAREEEKQLQEMIVALRNRLQDRNA